MNNEGIPVAEHLRADSAMQIPQPSEDLFDSYARNPWAEDTAIEQYADGLSNSVPRFVPVARSEALGENLNYQPNQIHSQVQPRLPQEQPRLLEFQPRLPQEQPHLLQVRPRLPEVQPLLPQIQPRPPQVQLRLPQAPSSSESRPQTSNSLRSGTALIDPALTGGRVSNNGFSLPQQTFQQHSSTGNVNKNFDMYQQSHDPTMAYHGHGMLSGAMQQYRPTENQVMCGSSQMNQGTSQNQYHSARGQMVQGQSFGFHPSTISGQQAPHNDPLPPNKGTSPTYHQQAPGDSDRYRFHTSNPMNQWAAVLENETGNMGSGGPSVSAAAIGNLMQHIEERGARKAQGQPHPNLMMPNMLSGNVYQQAQRMPQFDAVTAAERGKMVVRQQREQHRQENLPPASGSAAVLPEEEDDVIADFLRWSQPFQLALPEEKKRKSDSDNQSGPRKKAALGNEEEEDEEEEKEENPVGNHDWAAPEGEADARLAENPEFDIENILDDLKPIDFAPRQ